MVTEMAVALHAIGVKCDVHHVAEKGKNTQPADTLTSSSCDPLWQQCTMWQALVHGKLK